MRSYDRLCQGGNSRGAGGVTASYGPFDCSLRVADGGDLNWHLRYYITDQFCDDDDISGGQNA